MKKQHNNSILKGFSLVVYPIDFVVAIGDVEEEVNKKYQPYDDEYKDAHINHPPEFAGCTYNLKHRDSGQACVLIWMVKMEDCTSSVIAHECTHAAMEIWKYIGAEASLDNQEPFCYLLGNLVRLAVGTLYDIPGIKPPVIKKDKFTK